MGVHNRATDGTDFCLDSHHRRFL